MTPFELEITVQPGDIDQLGPVNLSHVNNVVYVRWMQDAAMAHWNSAATAEENEALLWVVLRHEIDYRRPAFVAERLIAKTWVGTATRLRFERLTEISRPADGKLLVQARSVWCPVSRISGRPAHLDPETRARFSAEPAKAG